jgi:hypothetical protein
MIIESLKKSLQHLVDALNSGNNETIDFYLKEVQEKLNGYSHKTIQCPVNEFSEHCTGDMPDVDGAPYGSQERMVSPI